MDWNWFFSSLAQSAAAIVGVFGAFIITKILSNQTAFSEKKNRLKELIAKAEKVKVEADELDFGWLNRWELNGKQRDFETLINGGIEEALIEGLKRYPVMNTENMEKKQESIKFVEREARHHTKLISDFHDSIKGNPESSWAINSALFLVSLLFCVGVIYPLSFMPTPTGWVPPAFSLKEFFDSAFQLKYILKDIKGVLLIAVSLIFFVIIFMFSLINNNMKYNSSDVEKLELFKSIGSYSKYFERMEKGRSKADSPIGNPPNP